MVPGYAAVTSDESTHFRKRLDELTDEIRTALALRDPSEDNITPDNAIGRLTRMETIQSQSMSAEGKLRLESRLHQVQRTWKRSSAANYGKCAQRGADIHRGRLAIMPETRPSVARAARRR